MNKKYYKTVDCDGDPSYYEIGDEVRTEFEDRIDQMIEDLSHQCTRWGEPLHSWADHINQDEVWSLNDDEEIFIMVEHHESEMLKYEK